ncbi:hypothetical protein ACH5RR_008399 [Cinchona calisaya]|uniref:Signal recognition particle subunit SRP68 n=1 Tax=Cinchona calisaya TaxID=153742 RepID=A0ABD3ABJ1_9GENT
MTSHSDGLRYGSGRPEFELRFAAVEIGSNAAWITVRRYCTARQRRLYKSLKFTHGHGKYSKRAIAASTVMDVRYLHVVLYTAERAWSHAMEKKTLPDGPNACQRCYLIGRLRKAVKWATLFQELCSIKGDSRTSLEAEAYASYMRGNLLFEQDKNWEVALKSFKSARAVYEELGKYGDLENQVLCREQVEELEPSIRYCLHKIGESNLQTSELVRIDEMEGPALDLFRTKLEAVMSGARSQQAASMTEFHWLGHQFPISNAKTRVSILKAQELEKDIHGPKADSLPADKRLVIFDKIFAAYMKPGVAFAMIWMLILAFHLFSFTLGNSESTKDDLSGLDKAIGAVRDDKHEKVTKPEEVVRLYDLLLQNAADLSDLVSSGGDRKPEELAFAEECELKSLVFRADRCFYVAKSYSLAGKRTETYALYCRARSLTDTALKKLRSSKTADQALTKQLQTFLTESRSNSCTEHAIAVMEKELAPETLSEKISTISLTGNDKKLEKFLTENLDVYESAVDTSVKSLPRIERFPPSFQAIAPNPVVLDLACNLIEFPLLEYRTKKEKKGFLGRLWR